MRPHRPGGEAVAGYCSLCDIDVSDLFAHDMLHFKQWDMERLVTFMAGVHPNECHSTRLRHPAFSHPAAVA